MAPRVSLIAPNSINVERHAYCLCLHVRPATIFVAVMNLTGSLFCSMVTFYLMVNNDYYKYSYSSSNGRGNYFATRFVREDMNKDNLTSILMCLLLSLVSAMLLYGVIKSKPRYILPFFGIQFVDYLFTLPQFFASMTHPYYYYVSKSKQMMDLQQQEPGDQFDMDTSQDLWPKYQPDLTNGSDGSLSTPHVYSTPLLILTLIMIFKTYFLCAVWKCYRYLHMKELILPITLNTTGNFLDSEAMLPSSMLVNGRHRTAATAAANVPPPNYEEATKLPECKPPEYAVVVGFDPVVVMPAPNTTNETASEGSISGVNLEVQSTPNIQPSKEEVQASKSDGSA